MKHWLKLLGMIEIFKVSTILQLIDFYNKNIIPKIVQNLYKINLRLDLSALFYHFFELSTELSTAFVENKKTSNYNKLNKCYSILTSKKHQNQQVVLNFQSMFHKFLQKIMIFPITTKFLPLILKLLPFIPKFYKIHKKTGFFSKKGYHSPNFTNQLDLFHFKKIHQQRF